MKACAECGFEARTGAGLASHRRARHTDGPPSGLTVVAALERDLRAVVGSEALKSAARTLAAAIDGGASGRDLPSLSRELRLVLDRLGVGDQEEPEQDGVDELARKRAARRATSSGVEQPSEG